MHLCNVRTLFEKTAIGIIRSFLGSYSKNQYLLFAIDYITKWPEIYTTLNQQALTMLMP
jgi:hypothetical protein